MKLKFLGPHVAETDAQTQKTDGIHSWQVTWV